MTSRAYRSAATCRASSQGAAIATHRLASVLARPGAGPVVFDRRISSLWFGQSLRLAVRLHVLHHAAEGAIHGAWMSDELAKHGYKISPGTLYPTLHRMEAEGLLASRRVVVEGRTRRVYRVTRKGRAVLGETRRVLRELADEVLG